MGVGDKAGFEVGGDVDRSKVGREEGADGDPVLGPDARFALLWFCKCRWMRQYIA